MIKKLGVALLNLQDFFRKNPKPVDGISVLKNFFLDLKDKKVKSDICAKVFQHRIVLNTLRYFSMKTMVCISIIFTSVDWFLCDRDLCHERLKQGRYSNYGEPFQET